MKNKAVIILCVVLFFNSCSVKSNTKDFIEQSESINSQISEVSNKVVEYISKGEQQKLYDMFSETNREQIDIMAQINDVFEEINVQELNFDNLKEHESGGGEDYQEGKIIRYSYGSVIEGITDKSENKYVISYGCTIIDDEHPEYIGLCQLSIYKVNYIDEYSYEIEVDNSIGDLTLHRR